MYRIPALVFVVSLISANVQAQQNSCDVSLTYLANEGVLVEATGEKILIDGLHSEYRRDYAFLPEDQQELLLSGSAPFDGIATVLVSHVHRDHFDADLVYRFIESNSGARLISSQQVTDSVSEVGSTERMQAVTYEDHSSIALGPDVTMRTAPLPHSSSRFRWIQNLGHRISFGDLSVLHVGDADINERNFVESGLVNEPVDVAILPYWYMVSSDGRRLIDEIIRPGRLIAAHVSPEDVEAVRREVELFYPDATVFGEMLETTVVIEQKCPDK